MEELMKGYESEKLEGVKDEGIALTEERWAQ